MIAKNSIPANLDNYAKILLTFSYANSSKNVIQISGLFIYLCVLKTIKAKTACIPHQIGISSWWGLLS